MPPQEFEDLLLAPAGGDTSREFEDMPVGGAVPEGHDWREPINEQHPGLSMVGRFNLKTYADAGPKTMTKNLKKLFGLEARHRGNMRFSVRRPGEREWWSLDESGWSPWQGVKKLFTSGERMRGLRQIAEPLSDVVDPAVAYSVSGAGMIGGALTTPLFPPAGAAVGSGVAETAKQGLGQMFGFEYDPQEQLHKIGEEAVIGAGGEVGGQLLARGAARTGYGRGIGAEIAQGGKALAPEARKAVESIMRQRQTRAGSYAPAVVPEEAAVKAVVPEEAAVKAVVPEELPGRLVPEKTEGLESYIRKIDLQLEEMRRLEALQRLQRERAGVERRTPGGEGGRRIEDNIRELEALRDRLTAPAKEAVPPPAPAAPAPAAPIPERPVELPPAVSPAAEVVGTPKGPTEMPSRLLPEEAKGLTPGTPAELGKLINEVPEGQRIFITFQKKGKKGQGPGDIRTMQVHPESPKWLPVDEIAANTESMSTAELRELVTESGGKLPGWIKKTYGKTEPSSLERGPLNEWLFENQPGVVTGRGGPSPETRAAENKLKGLFQFWEQFGFFTPDASAERSASKLLTGAIGGTKEVGGYRRGLQDKILQVEIEGAEGVSRYHFNAQGKATGTPGPGGALPPPRPPELRRTTIGEPGLEPFGTRTAGGARRPPGAGGAPGATKTADGPPAPNLARQAAAGEPAGASGPAQAGSPLRRAAHLARQLTGGTLKVAGSALEAPSRATKRGIESTLERVTRGRGSREALRVDREQATQAFRQTAQEMLEHPKVIESAELRASVEEVIDTVGRRNLRTEELRRAGQSLEDISRLIGSEPRTQEVVGAATKVLPKSAGPSFFGIPATAAPEASLASMVIPGAASVPGAPALAAIGAMGIAGKGLRAFGLSIMRDRSGQKLQKLVQHAQKSGKPELAEVFGRAIAARERGENAYKAAVFTMMHHPEVRKFLRSVTGEEELGNEDFRRIPKARAY